MSQLTSVIVVIGGLFAVLCVGLFVLVESGEVVVLRAAPEDGHRVLARLWVVDYQEDPWIGTTDPSKTDWVPWMRAHPRIDLERNGRSSCRQARFDEHRETSRRLDALLTEKYRFPSYGSKFLQLVGGAKRDVGERVWIRLGPCPRSD